MTDAGDQATTEVPLAGAAEPTPEAKPGKKGLFAKKGSKEPRPKKEKKPRAPRVKKAAKPRQPKEKKGSKSSKPPKAPRRQKSKSGGMGGTKQSPVGLDLGGSTITAVRLRYQTGGSQLLQAAIDSLPEGLINEGEVRDVEALTFAIKEFWKTHNIKSKKVALGLANQKVVVRTLEFPLLDEKELRSAIEFQAQDYIPIPVEDAVFDFHVLGQFTDEEGIEKQKVLVVAAQKNMVMDFVNAVKNARLTIAGIDLQAFALLRGLATTSFLDEGTAERATAFANIASDLTNLVVDVGGKPQFTRIVSFGGDDFTKAVQEIHGITFREAEILKERVGLPEPGQRAEDVTAAMEPPAAPAGGGEEKVWSEEPPAEAETEAENLANIQRVLETTADGLADEIRRSLDYYMSQEQSVPVDQLVISGGGALLRNLDVHLAQIFPFKVEVGNPMLHIAENKSDLTDVELQALAARLTISIGLALEDEE